MKFKKGLVNFIWKFKETFRSREKFKLDTGKMKHHKKI